MSRVNSPTSEQAVKIFQLCVNIIFGGVHKMVRVSLVAFVLLSAILTVISYKLGAWNKVRDIFQERRKTNPKNFFRQYGKPNLTN